MTNKTAPFPGAYQNKHGHWMSPSIPVTISVADLIAIEEKVVTRGEIAAKYGISMGTVKVRCDEFKASRTNNQDRPFSGHCDGCGKLFDNERGMLKTKNVVSLDGTPHWYCMDCEPEQYLTEPYMMPIS